MTTHSAESEVIKLFSYLPNVVENFLKAVSFVFISVIKLKYQQQVYF